MEQGDVSLGFPSGLPGDHFPAASLRAQYDTARALALHADIVTAAPVILQSFCSNLGWAVAGFWVVENHQIRCLTFFSETDYPHFREESLGRVFERGVGLAGMVWASGKAVLFDIASGPYFPRQQIALNAGCKIGMAVPVIVQDEVYGVVDFFRKNSLPNLQDHVASASSLASQMGQFLARDRQKHALEFSEEMHRAITGTAPDGILTMDDNSIILSANKAMEDIFGYGPGELLGKNLTILMSPEIARMHMAGMERYLKSGEKKVPWRGLELPGVRKDQSTIPLEVSFDELYVAGRRYFTGFIKDISERVQAREKLQHANRELEEKVHQRTLALQESNQQLEAFVYAVAHDLRAPLRTITSFADLLHDEFKGGESPEVNDYLQRIARAATNMDLLLVDLLKLSRVASGSLELKMINISQVIESVLSTFPDISRFVTVQGHFPHVLGDKALLEQVISNLISNAAKFVKPGVTPMIQIRSDIDRDMDMVRIDVQDNGIGIKPEHQDRIWDLFTKLHSSDQYAGTGVGLAIARRAAGRMNGTLSVSSEPGMGSTFTLSLRRAE